MIQIQKLKNHYFFSQPHQAFFVLAFCNAIFSMLFFSSVFEGLLTTDTPAKIYHTYAMIYLLFTPAFLAFLFTTFPKFSSTQAIKKREYLYVFALFFIASILFYLSFFSYHFLLLSIIFSFLGYLHAVKILWTTYKTSTITDKDDQFWILLAIVVGLFSHLILFLSFLFPMLYNFSLQLAIYPYLFLMFFSIAQRMVPFFSHTPITKNKERFKVIVGLLFLHVLLELIEPYSSFFVDAFLAYLIARELYRWKLPFPNSNPLVWILHIALFWIPIAFLLSSITNLISLLDGSSFLSLGIHTLAIGFFMTMLIGFGTRVTLGHSGNQMQIDNYTKYLFYATQVVVLLRILSSLFAGEYFFLVFNLTVLAWVLLFILWAYKFFAILIEGKKLE